MSSIVASESVVDSPFFEIDRLKQIKGDYHEGVKSIANARITQLLGVNDTVSLLEVEKIKGHVNNLMSLTRAEAEQYLDANSEVAKLIGVHSED